MATALALGPAAPAGAGTCEPAGSCSALGPLRLDGVLMVDPSQGRGERRLNGTPWIGPQWDASPVAVSPADTGFGLQTSLGHFGAYTGLALSKRLEEAKASAPGEVRMPKAPPRADPKLDIWAAVEARNIGEDTPREQASRLGADYKLNRQALLGATFGVASKEAVAKSAGEDSFTLATYFALRPFPALAVEARAGVGERHASSLQSTLDDTQRFSFLQLRSDWLLGAYKVSPALSLAHGESAASRPGVRGEQAEALTFAPRLSRSIDLGHGRRLEPFVSYERRLELGPLEGRLDETGTTRAERKVGAGLSLNMPDSYSLSLTTGIEESGPNALPNLRSGFELKLPLR